MPRHHQRRASLVRLTSSASVVFATMVGSATMAASWVAIPLSSAS
jgi:hypothetical protein